MMFGNSSEGSSGPRKRKRSNMEFDFIGGPAGPRKAQRTRKPAIDSAGPQEALTPEPPPVTPVPPASEPVASKVEDAPRTTTQETTFKTKTDEATPINPIKEKSSMASNNPSPVRSSSIDRQIREQKTVNNVLNGVALTMICGILFVAALAGTGGYVLWKQLQDQSASLALLEENTKDRMFDLKAELVASDVEMSKTMEQTNLRLVQLTAQFENYRSETSQSLAELKANNKSLERSLSYYQTKVNQQEDQLAMLRRRR